MIHSLRRRVIGCAYGSFAAPMSHSLRRRTSRSTYSPRKRHFVNFIAFERLALNRVREVNGSRGQKTDPDVGAGGRAIRCEQATARHAALMELQQVPLLEAA